MVPHVCQAVQALSIYCPLVKALECAERMGRRTDSRLSIKGERG